MKYTSKDLKAMARTQLTGKYGVYIGAYLLYFIIYFLVSTITSFVNIGNSLSSYPQSLLSVGNAPHLIVQFVIELIFNLILSILLLGFNKMFLDGSRGYPVRFEDLFYGFRHHPDRIILMQLLFQVITIACLLPGYLVLICAIYFTAPFALNLLGILLLIAGGIIAIYFSLAFSQSMWLMADYDDLGPIQALKESQKIMSGNKARFFYIGISFIGFLLLGMLTCFIGYLWILPYIQMTEANFYRNITDEI